MSVLDQPAVITDFVVRQEGVQLVSPTACCICARADGPMLDTMRDVEFYGRVYICVGTDERPGCLAQAARLAGWADPAYRTLLEGELGTLTMELADVRGSDLRTTVREEVATALTEVLDSAKED